MAFIIGCSRQEPPSPDGLYQQYAAREYLRVAQVNGFKLCDTVRIDVMMLQADDDDGWQQLMEEFNIRGDEGTVSWLGEIDHPAQRTYWTGVPVMRVIASHGRHTIGFYRIDNESQYDALIDYQLEKTSTKY